MTKQIMSIEVVDRTSDGFQVSTDIQLGNNVGDTVQMMTKLFSRVGAEVGKQIAASESLTNVPEGAYIYAGIGTLLEAMLDELKLQSNFDFKKTLDE